jgi:hypothetical protein
LTTALIHRPLDPEEIRRFLAHEARQHIIELGAEIEQREQEQAQHLLWFYKNPKTWQSLGYNSFKEFFFQEDIQQALGLNATSQGAHSRVFGLFLVHAAIPEAAVFEKGHSKLEAAMPILRPMAAAALEAPPERARELKSTLLNAVNRYRDLKYREVTHRVQTQRPSPYRLTANSNKPAIAEADDKTGEMDVLLVQTSDCDTVGAGRAMARILKSRTFFMWDEEGIWTRIEEGYWKLALRWARGDIPYKVRERAAEACGAEERV